MEDEMLKKIQEPAHKRSIRDIPLPENKKSQKQRTASAVDLRKFPQPEKEKNQANKNKKKKRRKSKSKLYFTITTVGVFIIVLVVFSNLLSTATVNIVPRTYEIAEADITLDLIPAEEVVDDAGLGYRQIEFSKTAEVKVPANGEELVQEKASGIITVYNEFTSSPQKFIKNTRFESEDGFIYRTPVSLEIPGYTESNGEIVPGKLDVEVFADKIGQAYNISTKTNFTVPGFEGQEAFNYFSAVNKTNIDGGYDGVKKIVKTEDLDNAKSDLNNQVIGLLEEEVSKQIPNNVVALYSPESFSYGTVEQEDLSESEVLLKMSSELSVILIDKRDLASSLAQTQPDAGYRVNEEIEIKNLDELELILIDNSDGKEIKINGNIHFVWINNTDLLASDLAGKNKDQFRNIVSNYRGVVSVTTKFFPFWNNKFPEKSTRIEINQN
jgi:hypothetical protein